MSTVCSALCQHPGCWRSEVDELRNALRYEGTDENLASFKKYDKQTEKILENNASLPTYHILNLFEDGSTCNDDQTDDRCAQSANQPNWSSFQIYQTNKSVASQSNPCSGYMRKVWQRQKEVEKLERKAYSAQDEVKFKTLELEDKYTINDEYEKIFTWVPPKQLKKKELKESNTKDNKLKMKTIDGNNLPPGHMYHGINKDRKRLLSPTGGQPYKIKGVRQQMLFTDDMWEHLELFKLLGMSTYDYRRDSNNVTIPSSLRTKSLSLGKLSPLKHEMIADKINSRLSTNEILLEENQSEPSLIASDIQSDEILPKVPVSRKKSRSFKRRTPLQLTRVSVPKKTIRRYPLFNHCSSSIRRKQLPDVSMQPLSSSERSSIVSSSTSLPGKHESQIGRQSSDDTKSFKVSVPSIPSDKNESVVKASSTETLKHAESANYQIEKIFHENNVEAGHVTFGLPNDDGVLIGEEKEDIEVNTINTVHQHRDGLNLDLPKPNANPSAIMISKASKSLAALHLNDEGERTQSPTYSTTSRASSEDCDTDKEIIQRTYDKYQSLTPFKTPMGSRHVIGEVDNREEKIVRQVNLPRSPTASRVLLPQSMHNLDQFLPTEDASLKVNNSFISRSLSPSRSMFIRQQKQPPQDTVHRELMVSRVIPERSKSPFQLLPTDLKLKPKSMVSQKSFSTAFLTPIPSAFRGLAPPSSPTGLTPSCTDLSRVSDTLEDEEYEEEVLIKGEVLLTQNGLLSIDDLLSADSSGTSQTVHIPCCKNNLSPSSSKQPSVDEAVVETGGLTVSSSHNAGNITNEPNEHLPNANTVVTTKPPVSAVGQASSDDKLVLVTEPVCDFNDNNVIAEPAGHVSPCDNTILVTEEPSENPAPIDQNFIPDDSSNLPFLIDNAIIVTEASHRDLDNNVRLIEQSGEYVSNDDDIRVSVESNNNSSNLTNSVPEEGVDQVTNECLTHQDIGDSTSEVLVESGMTENTLTNEAEIIDDLTYKNIDNPIKTECEKTENNTDQSETGNLLIETECIPDINLEQNERPLSMIGVEKAEQITIPPTPIFDESQLQDFSDILDSDLGLDEEVL